MFDKKVVISAIVRVGEDGRGFVVQGSRERLVITAGHNLPWFPPCHGFSFREERTYMALLGKLGKKPTVCAECQFVDPIADLAVLGPPDNQQYGEEWEVYEELVKDMSAMAIDDAAKSGRAQLLSLSGEWFGCTARHDGLGIWITGASKGIQAGMSGSPIVDGKGAALGVVCLGGGRPGKLLKEGGPNPRLFAQLPSWLLRELIEQGTCQTGI